MKKDEKTGYANMSERIRISHNRVTGGFGWPERIVGAVLGVLILLIALAFGVLIVGVLAVGALVLAVRVWWWRRRLQQSNRYERAVIEGEYRVLEQRRAGDKEH